MAADGKRLDFATRLRPGRCAAVVAFALVAASATRAEATCGDYLAHGTPAHGATGELPPLGSGSPAAPCDGPSCRRSNHDAPLPPAPYRSVEGPERWARLLDEAAARPASCERLAPGDEPPTAGGDPRRIDRPPRG